jgi:hypothetical protein
MTRAGSSFALAALAAAWVTCAEAHAESPEGRRSSYQTATGTLDSYDSATRVLTVRSASGSKEFHVAPDARLWLGSRRVPVKELSSSAGAEVTIAWSDVDGVRTTHTVRVSEARRVRAR